MCSLNPWQAWDDLTRTFSSALSSPCHPKVKARWQPSSILFKLWRKKLVSFHCPWRMWIHTSYLRPVKLHICAHCEESPKMKISFWLRYEKLHLDLMVWVNISSCHLFAENSILITDLWENNKLTFFTKRSIFSTIILPYLIFVMNAVNAVRVKFLAECKKIPEEPEK